MQFLQTIIIPLDFQFVIIKLFFIFSSLSLQIIDIFGSFVFAPAMTVCGLRGIGKPLVATMTESGASQELLYWQGKTIGVPTS